MQWEVKQRGKSETGKTKPYLQSLQLRIGKGCPWALLLTVALFLRLLRASVARTCSESKREREKKKINKNVTGFNDCKIARQENAPRDATRGRDGERYSTVGE